MTWLSQHLGAGSHLRLGGGQKWEFRQGVMGVTWAALTTTTIDIYLMKSTGERSQAARLEYNLHLFISNLPPPKETNPQAAKNTTTNQI